MASAITSKRIRRLAVAAVALAIVATVSSCSPPDSTQNSVDPPPSTMTAKYVAVIDSGSSGSRLYLYANDSDDDQTKVKELYSLDPKSGSIPGFGALASYVSDPAKAGPDGIAPLLDGLSAYLTENAIPKSEVPIEVGATAGMREATLENPAAVEQIYVSVNSTVTDEGFTPISIGTISGQSEGVYSWTDVNYSTGAFGTDAAAKSPDTLGIVEIGGASAQVAFQSTVTQERDPNVVDLTIDETAYKVYSLSYLGLGRNSARISTIPPSAATAGSFCYPNNKAGAEPSTYGLGNQVAVAAAESRFSADQCRDAYGSTIATTGGNSFNQDQTHGVAPTQVRAAAGFAAARFTGLASIADAFDKFKIKKSGDEVKDLKAAVEKQCSGSNAWSKISKLFKAKLTDKSENACANATLVRAFTFTDVGVNVESDNFQTYADADEATWTRGYAVLRFADDRSG